MPQFKIQTPVSASMRDVWAQFDKSLLLKISPPFPKVHIRRFDGCLRGDEVELEIQVFGMKILWTSHITESKETAKKIYFIDEGRIVPFGIQSWKHVHSIISVNEKTCIVEDFVTYQTKFIILDYLLFPMLWGMMLYRKPFYKKYLNHETKSYQ